MRFWLGGYTPEMEGSARGIGGLLAGAPDDPLAGGPLAYTGGVVRARREDEIPDAAAADPSIARDPAAMGSPSWLAAHPRLDVVYAALEGSAQVVALRRAGDSELEYLGAPVPVGDTVCHVAVAPDASSLVASAWGDGKVVRVALDAAGRPGRPVTAAAASDPYGDDSDEASAATFASAGAIDLAAAARALREAAGEEYAHFVPDHDAAPAPEPGTDAAEEPARTSRAHAAAFLPDGRIATTDLGFDLVRIWRDTATGLRLDHEVVLPKGCGPRHMVVHPSGHLHVVTEFSGEVFTLGRDREGRWRVLAGTAASPAAGLGDTGAELAMSRDGQFLYAGLRGSNTIATLRVRGAGETVEPVALADSGVDWPRHHLLVRDTLLVAGQRSNEVVSLTLDERTGAPGRVRHRAEVPSPSCILPAR
ncbi:lactonase family protein [Microbacterium immunditiarum]|uniref:6-phosphogluconolactonase (Cycloisomerase 2 family) n=1 Tax=Microbacterium immunditiarum TaxID=337480 RepID=A0A7Y9KIH0_9MICO|nr:6-phosphogluconolactonase (cycloisomerase 2 family) [Microbacterium immunditiarum]